MVKRWSGPVEGGGACRAGGGSEAPPCALPVRRRFPVRADGRRRAVLNDAVALFQLREIGEQPVSGGEADADVAELPELGEIPAFRAKSSVPAGAKSDNVLSPDNRIMPHMSETM